MSETYKKTTETMTSPTENAAVYAASLICDDAPKQAWRWQKKKQQLCSTVGDTNIILSSCRLNEKKNIAVRCTGTTHSQQLSFLK